MQFNLAPDKAGHFIAGSLVAAAAAMAVIHLLHRPPLAWVAAMAAAVVVGALKELSDHLINQRRARAGQPPSHTVDGGDLLATALGGVPVAAPLGLLTLVAAGVA